MRDSLKPLASLMRIITEVNILALSVDSPEMCNTLFRIKDELSEMMDDI